MNHYSQLVDMPSDNDENKVQQSVMSNTVILSSNK